MSGKTVKSAWLITKESYKNKEKIISILKRQRGIEKITEYLIQLYVDSLSASDKVAYLNNNGLEGLPYKPRFEDKKKMIISIGHNPCFCARKVKNLRVIKENIFWEE